MSDLEVSHLKKDYSQSPPEGGWTSWDQFTESTRDYISLFPSLKELRELGILQNFLDTCEDARGIGSPDYEYFIRWFDQLRKKVNREILQTAREIAEENNCQVALYAK